MMLSALKEHTVVWDTEKGAEMSHKLWQVLSQAHISSKEEQKSFHEEVVPLDGYKCIHKFCM